MSPPPDLLVYCCKEEGNTAIEQNWSAVGSVAPGPGEIGGQVFRPDICREAAEFQFDIVDLIKLGQCRPADSEHYCGPIDDSFRKTLPMNGDIGLLMLRH